MADNEIIDRIKYLIKSLNCRQGEFAQKIGIDTSNLSKYLNGRLPVSDALVNRIVVNLGVNKQWLETGSDLPYAKPVPVAAEPAPQSQGEASRLRRGVPVYDIDVTAGPSPRAQLFADEHIVGSINLPGLDPSCRIVTVAGDSMSPVIRPGDYIAVRELTDTRIINWGQIYVVILPDYRLVKYVRRHSDPGMVILHSENPNYDDMDVPREAILGLLYVQHIIHLETRN